MQHISFALQAQAHADDLRVTNIFHPHLAPMALVLEAQATADRLWAQATNGGVQ